MQGYVPERALQVIVPSILYELRNERIFVYLQVFRLIDTHIGSKLLSISAASKLGTKCVIDNKGIEMHLNNKVIMSAPITNGTYLIKLDIVANNQNALTAYFGHMASATSTYPKGAGY